MKELVQQLVKLGVLQTPRLIEAFLANDRRQFVLPEYREDAYVDAPLAIGSGQTISQPYTVAFMMELLDPRPGQKVLDIGFGSGWTTAILAHAVGKTGRVYGLEIVPEVYELGRVNLEKFSYPNVELYNRSGWEGYEEASPFDRIIAGAAPPRIPPKLKEQLGLGGKLVIPVGSQLACAIVLVDRVGKQNFREQSHPGFAFVPFVK